MAPTMVKYGFLPVKRTVFFLCDMQEKCRGEQLYFDEIVETAGKMLQASKLFDIPLIVTEQCPKIYGKTVKELDISHAHGIYSKTKFSMAIPEVGMQLDSLCDGNVQCVVLFGMQAHICVEQTAAELCALGIQVHIIADACTSSSQEERILALQRLKQIGCFITTSESILFKLLGDEDHPKYNDVKRLLDKPHQPTGLAAVM
ncbi:isochorismatase domain-containing protein 2-like [Lycorma delicatula]|uniref:isochorismatase domain-containing protein 2-like n=1 Tax=Lycorma delicatula TaxID=130591 RepID=UPI003F50F5F7